MPRCGPASTQRRFSIGSARYNRLSEMSLGIERMTELVVRLRTFSRLDEGIAPLLDQRFSFSEPRALS
jgi:hypothetical protein